MTSSVATFSVSFSCPDGLPEVGSVEFLESQILSRLENPERLLRWAIVRIEANQVTCEGAYLSRA